jgi:competence protein ComEA
MKPNWTLVIGLIVAAVLLIGAGYALANVRGADEPAGVEIIPPAPTATPAPPPTPLPTATSGPLRVYVSGAVVNPAVYELPPGSIIDDAVRAAGGFSADADPVAVNLAGPLADGMQIYVPTTAEGAATPPPISAPAATTDPGASRMGGVTIGGLIDINLATQADLEMLPGIGPTTAANIIAHREANGPFATIEAIMDVPGIGEGKFAAMKDLITVGP